MTLVKKSSPEDGFPNVEVILTPEHLDNSANVIRVIAHDHSKPMDHGFEQVGTISLTVDYFKNIPENRHGSIFTQWITLFDDVEDDEFDGDLGDDDEEMPMIRTHMTLEAIERRAAPPKSVSTPKLNKARTPAAKAANVTPRNNGGNPTLFNKRLTVMPQTSASSGNMAAMASPTAKRRKTITDTNGARKVVQAEEEQQMPEPQ